MFSLKKQYTDTWVQTAYRDLQSVQPPCGSAVSWGWRCGRGQTSPCWRRWRWWPHGSARQPPGWHYGSSVQVMESEGWLELRVEGTKQTLGKNQTKKRKHNDMKAVSRLSAWHQCDLLWKGLFTERPWKSSQSESRGLRAREMFETTDCSVFDCEPSVFHSVARGENAGPCDNTTSSDQT